MTTPIEKQIPRRDFVKLAVSAAALGPFFLFPDRARASQKTLKIAKWAHFAADFDSWFEGMAMDWGQQHDTRVMVDEIPLEKISAAANAEIKAGRGHDVFMFP
jgi:multiple sugar transport system substrate-binding protein